MSDHQLAVIFSLSGPVLSDAEKSLFKEANPLGFILFARNCEHPEQVRSLTDSLRDLTGRHCPVLIDQEGGRVQRLKPPVWRGYAPAGTFGAIAAHDMQEALQDVRFRTLQLSQELRECGINVNCDPVLDVSMDYTHDVIGDRAYSDDPAIVARLGLSICRHYLAAGITPVVKHMPGHGRAKADSHKELPVVDASLEELRAVDFAPFKAIADSEIAPGVWGMPTPVLFSAIDPDHAACASVKIIQDVIRGEMGFDGVLVSDALDMEGLAHYGDAAGRVRAVLQAGCDLALHCTGKLDEMEKIAESVPNLSEKAQKRLQKAEELRKVTSHE